MDTAERLENSIKNQPQRWIVVRGNNDELLEALDKDTGRIWVRMGNKSWAWIE